MARMLQFGAKRKVVMQGQETVPWPSRVTAAGTGGHRAVPPKDWWPGQVTPPHSTTGDAGQTKGSPEAAGTGTRSETQTLSIEPPDPPPLHTTQGPDPIKAPAALSSGAASVRKIS